MPDEDSQASSSISHLSDASRTLANPVGVDHAPPDQVAKKKIQRFTYYIFFYFLDVIVFLTGV